MTRLALFAIVLPQALFGLEIPANLGYLAVGGLIFTESMGIPSPGETALAAGALLAASGKLQIELVIAAAIAGAIIGDNLGYLIGRTGGRQLLTRPGPFHARRVTLVDYGERFFEKHGPKAVFLGRWVALLRATAALMAGVTGMPAKSFFLWNALGGITWATTIGLVVYGAGHAGEEVFEKVGIAGAIVGLFVGIGLIVWGRRREHRTLARHAAGDAPLAGAAPDRPDPAEADVNAPPPPSGVDRADA